MKTLTYLPIGIRKYSMVILMILSVISKSQIVSLATGNWDTPGTWSPSGVPSGGDNVTINGAILLDKNLTAGAGIAGSLTINAGKSLISVTGKDITVKNGGLLVVYGTLEVDNLDFLNGSNIHLASGGIITVRKNFSNHNNSTEVIIDGTLSIYGNAYNGNGAAINGSGSINTFGGAFTGSGTISPTISLPVDLLTFSAYEESNKVELNWATASEMNNDHFTVERSADGINFSAIGQVKGAGNSAVVNEYRMSDELPSTTVYYRLKQTDYNGSFSYNGGLVVLTPTSQVKTIEALVYPNPVQDSNVYVKLEGDNYGSRTEVVLSDISGKEICRFSLSDVGTLLTIPQIVLTPGIYVLTIRTGTTEISKNLMVK